MHRPYFEEIGIEPVYTTEDLLEQVYDDRNLEEEDENLDWETTRQSLEDDIE